MASEAISCVISTLCNHTQGSGKFNDAPGVADEYRGGALYDTFMIALTLIAVVLLIQGEKSPENAADGRMKTESSHTEVRKRLVVSVN
jgi:hypothetical protein